MSDVHQRIKEIIAAEVSIDPSTIESGSSLEDLNVTSIDLVQIMFLVEEEYDIYLADEELGFDVENVGMVFDAVDRLIAAKAEASA
jgi:acyl carrier protein